MARKSLIKIICILLVAATHMAAAIGFVISTVEGGHPFVSIGCLIVAVISLVEFKRVIVHDP